MDKVRVWIVDKVRVWLGLGLGLGLGFGVIFDFNFLTFSVRSQIVRTQRK